MINVITGPESYTKNLLDYIDERIKLWEKQKRQSDISKRVSIAPDFVLTELDIMRDRIKKGILDAKDII